MKPGRDMDALIEDKVIGLTRLHDGNEASNFEPVFEGGFRAPDYSTDLNCAMTLFTGLSRFYVSGTIEVGLHMNSCAFNKVYESSTAYGDTLPHAICLAALKVKGVNV